MMIYDISSNSVATALQSVEMMRNTSYSLLCGICNQSYILVAPTIMTMLLLMRMSERNVVLAS